MSQDIILTVDYHDRACVIRRLDRGADREQVFTEIPTTAASLGQVVDQARRDLYQVRKFRAPRFQGSYRLGKMDQVSGSHQELDRWSSKTITASKNYND